MPRNILANNSIRPRLRIFIFLLFLFAPARERAFAQFGFPYDPDLTPPPAQAPAQIAQPLPGEILQLPTAGSLGVSTRTAEIAIAVPSTLGPFLLLDRSNPSHILIQEEPMQPEPFEDFVAKLRPFSPDQVRWNQMRSDVEQGTAPTEEIAAPIQPLPPEVLLSTEAPSAPPPEVELPGYGTSLSITGRKVLGFNYTAQNYYSDQTLTGRPKSTNLINITQQLQLRMQGKVGPKISVNVDYDDTNVNKQDISVVYTGDPNEVVQNASFGDIDLSLPATEFVSYNKQLFGIRVDIKYKGTSASFIGSRTKGTTKLKQFIGNTQFAAADIPDSSYIRHVYYDLSFGNPARLPLKPGSERIFLAQQNVVANNAQTVNMTVDDMGVPSSTFTGSFNQMFSGTDYTIDYITGILTLHASAQPQYIIAVDYIDAQNNHVINETSTTFSGGTGFLKIIKDAGDVPISVSSTTGAMELGPTRELKTIYSIGATQIVRDNGQGNFIWRVIDPQTRNEVGSILNPPQIYPANVTVNFENGIFRLLNPFSVNNSSPGIIDPVLYSPTPVQERLIHIEYRFRIKTFLLEPNLVLQSEVVLVDGVKLVRNVDYYIDYVSGFITFFDENRIGINSEVDISYEVAPTVGGTNESILGTRVAQEFNKHFAVGSTLLYDAGTKAPTVPTIDELAKSLLIYDFDSQLKEIHLLPKLKATIQVEYAHSIQNPNLNGKAIIDNMEGIQQEIAAAMLSTQWQIAANPTSSPADPLSQTLSNVQIPTLNINPHSQAPQNQTEQVLNFSYNFGVNATTETSIVYVFSPFGVDMSQKTLLDVVMNGDGSNNEINFTIGQINEDADGTGGMTLNCTNGTVLLHAPKTNDIDCDGILQPGEDIGWTYAPVGKNHVQIGASFGRIVSEDLNQNGRLDPGDPTVGGNFGYNFATGTANNQLFDVTSGSTRTRVDFTGWHEFQIPLGISTATVSAWTNVVDVRVSVRQSGIGVARGNLQFARISVTGNSWLNGQAGDPSNGSGPISNESVTITAVNNANDPIYVPIFNAGGDAQATYNDLYGSVGQQQQLANSQNLTEQALQISWKNLTEGATVYTKRIFSAPIDLTSHKRFNFLLYGNADPTHITRSTDTVFFLRAGSDQSYFEVDVPLNYVGWRRIEVNQIDPTGGQTPNTWQLSQGPPGTVVFSTASPNLQQIAELTTGVYGSGLRPAAQEALWLDEIYVSNANTRAGTAQKLQLDFDAPGWATFGGKYRSVDRNYQTPTTTISNQDNEQDNAYLNFTRMTHFPMNFQLARTKVNTPNANAVGTNANVVNVLQQGLVTTWNGSASGNFAYGTYPRVSLSYNRARTEYNFLTRLDDRNTYTTALNYAVPLNRRWIPKTVDLTGTYSTYGISFDSLLARTTPGNFNTFEYTKTMGARLSFIPWNGASFNPNYNLSYVYEKRQDFTSGKELDSKYPKSENQAAGFTSNWRLTRWLNPAVSYAETNIENNILNVSTFVVGASTYVFNVGDIKTVNRSANGSISVPINISDIWGKTKLLRSMNIANNYTLQDGDTWNNVEKDLDTKLALWVRTPLRTINPAAQLTNMTLRDTYNSSQRWSPLEAYNILGRKSAFKTLAISNNYVKSIQRTNTTGTLSKTITTTVPDLVGSLGQLEKLLYSERWMSNGQVNIKYAAHRTENVATSLTKDGAVNTTLRAMIVKRFDSAVSFNFSNASTKDLIQNVITQTTHHEDGTVQTTFDVQKFRFTPKIDYAKDVAANGTGGETQHLTTLTPSILSRADLALPRGLMLPFTKAPLLFTNRIIWTSTLSLAVKKSPVTEEDNSKLLSFNTSGDYEIAKNLRMTLNGAFSRLWHDFLPQESFLSYQFGTTLTFQF